MITLRIDEDYLSCSSNVKRWETRRENWLAVRGHRREIGAVHSSIKLMEVRHREYRHLCIDLHGLRSFCSRKWNNGWTLASASALDLGAPPHSPPQAIACQPLTTEIHPDVLRKRRRFINFRTNRLTVPWEIITLTISSRIAGNLAQD